MGTTFGMILCALGGLAGAVFALPFRGIRGWRYESYWFIYAIAGLVVFPLALGLTTCPALFKVIGETEGTTLLRCIGFGAMWGLGGLTWGLMIRYLGIGLGLAIGCGLCSATGTLIPPIVTGHAADLFKDTAAVITFASVVVSIVGIVLVGLAGKLKEGELSEEEKRRAVAEFDFKKGILVAIFSGVASAGMNFGLQGGASMEAAAAAAGVDAKWIGMPVLVVVLWGGFLVNGAWCLWQNAKNRSFGDYRHFASVGGALAILAGVIWALQFACQKVGEPSMGEMRYISFAVVMGSCVLFSSLLGVLLGEWRGTGTRTRTALAAGLLVLACSIGIAVAGKSADRDAAKPEPIKFSNPVIACDWPDPTVWSDGAGGYCSVATGLRTLMRSPDLVHWTDAKTSPITPAARAVLEKVTRNIWAPCVVRVGATWNLYISLFVSDANCKIAVLTAGSPTGPFEFRGFVVDSVREKVLNAIDPFVLSADGRLLMFFGSLADGVHVVELAADGLSIAPGAELRHVAGIRRPASKMKGAYEGAYVMRRGDWWYLFVSGGNYADHTYYLTVGRSDKVTGPYCDREGKPLTAGQAKPILTSSREDHFYGPGHNGDVFTGAEGRTYMFYHSHCKANRPAERPTLLQEIKWTDDGWPFFEGDKPAAEATLLKCP